MCKPLKVALEDRLAESGLKLKSRAQDKIDAWVDVIMMSFLHSHYSECVKSELDLFTVPPTQTCIENSQFIYYNPVCMLSDNAPIEFIVPVHGKEYIDLAHTIIKVGDRILRPDGCAALEDSVGPVNNVLPSLFNQVDVYFNQIVVTSANDLYAYRGYIETLLTYGTDAKS
ncbi:uncharacterized protein F54H12.2-like [Diachasmimorpha longicaudata]|uniref:uncharacterized protein F54H12.2-like n=1 Tax=Diachasmimorpha longicaudata TaxID=58733 RepID=UPI0030B8F4ED